MYACLHRHVIQHLNWTNSNKQLIVASISLEQLFIAFYPGTLSVRIALVKAAQRRRGCRWQR